MEECKIKNLYNLEETIAKELLESVTYPWEALPKIEEFILKIGEKLDKEKYEKKGRPCALLRSPLHITFSNYFSSFRPTSMPS